MSQNLEHIFPACFDALPDRFWEIFWPTSPAEIAAEDLPALMNDLMPDAAVIPEHLPDLARVELAIHRAARSTLAIPENLREHRVNPTLELLDVSWQGLLEYLDDRTIKPVRRDQWLLFWRNPSDDRLCRAVAGRQELVALKMVVERLEPEQLAGETGLPIGHFDALVDTAVERGLLLAPPPTLDREATGVPLPGEIPQRYRRAEVFTLQWHITHTCDLHCRHCYDRSRRDDVAFEQGVRILDQMRAFCRERYVGGQVSFSGGNPFLHPRFTDLYRAAVERNLTPAILGNPVGEEQLETILGIAPPTFFQVSLEGLQEHNDHIRGSGNFNNVLEFLDLLKRKGIYSMVMLTLTRANLDQVLPLAEVLRERVDLFTFNRLAMVGEGASLLSPGAEEYHAFLRAYLDAKRQNPVMALKDSLLNICLEESKSGLFGGCTGYGCGAAFNFVSLLPDGQVHACRKFPSPIGDITRQTLAEIYDSSAARSYRRGCTACDDCRLRPVCGGCLAVTYGFGLDPLAHKDPACFIDQDT